VRIGVGRVGRAHGVRGEVFVDVRTDDPDVRFAPGAVLFTGEDGSATLTVARSRWHSGRLVVAFEGATDRTAAESLAGTPLYRALEDRIEEAQAWYDHDIIGCSVHSGGAIVGTVTDVIHLPAQDLLSVDVGSGPPRLVPLVAELVSEVDMATRVIRVSDIPGLLRDADG